MKQAIIASEGSIQGIADIPNDIKELYRTVWEISQRHIINLAADRGAFVCQSQSMNIYMQDATFAKLTSMHFYGWQKGLKTGSYYIRQTAARQAQKFTVDANVEKQQREKREDFRKATDYLLDSGKATRADLKGLSQDEVIAWAQGLARRIILKTALCVRVDAGLRFKKASVLCRGFFLVYLCN